MRISNLEDLQKIGERGLSLLHPPKIRINVGMATCGLATGAQEVFDSLKDESARQGLDAILLAVGCLGYCQQEPLVEVIKPGWPGLIYSRVSPEKGKEIISSLARGEFSPGALAKMEEEENLIEGTSYRFPSGGLPKEIEALPSIKEIPFWKKQRKIILRNSGLIDPSNIEEYIARGGYLSLAKALSLSPEAIIAEVSSSGLRGRGGAGFPTGRKWQLCREARGFPKYVICNADEGDPGAYMDRTVLEGDPHSVIEGMIIGAYAIGANSGYIYVRDEYPLAVRSIRQAVSQAQELGLLGTDILGSGFDFTLEIVRGAGAFVCGEETALIHSIQGEIGEPHPRPPFPAHSGLWGKPTIINNVKTWASISPIISQGADFYRTLGTEKSKGTTVFSLVGKVNNTGLAEIPLGIKLREMIFDIGGGIPSDKAFKAVQTGGPSGGVIPASGLELPVDYEPLTEAGSIMGSGGMVVMDEDSCMVDVARFFLAFTMAESCGKCTPCREGIQQMYEILSRITSGEGREGDIELLEELGKMVKESSLCGLGQTAPNPVLSTIRYFRQEYGAHIKYKRCPAVVCREIISSPCQHACPLNQDVPSYLALIAQGRFQEAIQVIRRENPLPSVCGRVCHHPCEDKCRLAEEPIAIRALKRFVADYEANNKIPIPKAAAHREEKVGIVGSGPAGLTAGYYLALWGYPVTIWEALPVVGGMLRVGIPEYRLPREILDREISSIQEMGVDIRTNSPLGSSLSLEEIKAQGYKAIFLAFGAQKGLKLNIPGEDVQGVMDALDFLKKVNLKEELPLGKKVVIVGGGNAAIDSARVARRLGAEDVQIVYRRTKAEMPADKEEVNAAIEEGIKIRFLANPTRAISADGKLQAVECISMELGEVDESGRRKPIPIPDSNFIIEADTLISAIGQKVESSFLKDYGIGLSPSGTILVDPETLATNLPGIFAGGDAVSGPSTVTEAMAQGKVAASSIDKFLKGEPLERTYRVTRPSLYVQPLELSAEELEEIAVQGRAKIPAIFPSLRIQGFNEVNLPLSEEEAIKEARRCLRCDLEVERKEI